MRFTSTVALLREMTDALTHRGPDGEGYWLDRSEQVALGHRRLAIIDLTQAGAQPMKSESGRFVIVFNGEIYNFRELRRDLEARGCKFVGCSDTEVLLAGFEVWGVRRTIERSIGMFAIALWDDVEHRLTLIRDRLGKKPLYYGLVDGDLLFASELKSFWKYPGFAGDVDRGALTKYLRHSYVPSPYSIFSGVYKLPPGTMLEIRAGEHGLAVGDPVAYWSAADVFARGRRARTTTNDLVDRLDTLLRSAVSLRMISDVPLGAFLSGGIDSSLVVALMQQQSDRPVRTFSIGFREQQYDEAPFARAVASHLGTDHTETYLTAADALAVVPRLPETFDEPFSDPSQIPTLMVAQVARRHVTVALSGDGGDELFCGYGRYLRWRRLWSVIGRTPKPVARTGWRILQQLMRLPPMDSPKLRKLAEILAAPDPRGTYLRFVSHWTSPAAVVLGGHEPPSILTEPGGSENVDEFTEEMMELDVRTYLPDDILVKVDRSTMAESLESRAPLLDHRVVEFAASLPLSAKLHDGVSKWVLREVLYRYVPKVLVDRPKMGFGVPIDSWLVGPLRDWAEDLLSEARLERDGFFDAAPIRKLWADHKTGRQQAHYYLWDVLMFQSWLDHGRSRRQVDRSSTQTMLA